MYSFTWTLAVEEHFYLMLAALVAWRVHKDGHPQRLLPIVVAALPTVLLLRCYWAWQWPVGHLSHIHPTHLRLDGLAFGVALGTWRSFMAGRWRHGSGGGGGPCSAAVPHWL
jgi:peptidoglycan/LPS O-acetylase OafA/YrhL